MDDARITLHYFVVEIEGIETARFLQCEGIEMNTESFEIEEGGCNTTTHKFLGKTQMSEYHSKERCY